MELQDSRLNLWVWKRPGLALKSSWTRAFLKRDALLCRDTLEIGANQSLFSALADEAPELSFATIREDAQLCAEALFDSCGCKRVSAKLQVVQSRTCPRFHVDYVSLRVVITYRGFGTEWLDESGADRSFLGRPIDVEALQHGGRDPVLREDGFVHRANPGDVLWMKGKRFARSMPASVNGLVHRSPKLRHGSKRLVLTLDVES